jgi:restriction system protein
VIEDGTPSHWRDLEDKVAQILNECGLEAKTEQTVDLVRGTVVVDVLALDPEATPPATYICECKYWRKPVSKNVVHSFRTVLADMGAHRGFLISSLGFQSGAREAAAHTNLDLVTWDEFQSIFEERWFRQFMAPTLRDRGDPLEDYTELINTRVFGKADRLPEERQEDFRRLREQYWEPVWKLGVLWFSWFSPPKPPALPLRNSLVGDPEESGIPAQILDAVALRLLMEAVTGFYSQATAEFDAVFGERA